MICDNLIVSARNIKYNKNIIVKHDEKDDLKIDPNFKTIDLGLYLLPWTLDRLVYY